MKFDFKRMLQFEHNIGAKDKRYRMLGGAALILVAVFTAKILLLMLGMLLVITSYAGWCPVYSGLTKSTCEAKSE